MVVREAQVQAARRGHPLGQAPHDVQVLRVEVDEHDLRAGEAGAVVVDEGRHGACRARRSTSEVGQPDRCHSSLLDGARQEPTHEVSLQEDVEDDDRDGDQHGSGSHDRLVADALRTREE